MTDPDGKPLANAKISVFNSTQTAVVGTGDSDPNGLVTFEAVPKVVRVFVDHPLGYKSIEVVNVAQTAPTTLEVAVLPRSPVTVALLPVTVAAGSVSADRTELDLQVSIVSSALSKFEPSSYGSYVGSQPTPYLRLNDDCTVWLDSLRASPACVYEDSGRVTAKAYSHDPLGTPAASAARGSYSALLLLDQSRRVAEYDPHGVRNLAAKRFIRRARPPDLDGVVGDLTGIAGFAGRDGDSSSPPLLPQLPLWVQPSAPTIFSSDYAARAAAVDSLVPLVGGSAPVFDALGAAMTLIAAHKIEGWGGWTWRPAMVVLLGGSDDSGLSASQRQTALASLRKQQADTGIQVVLVAPRLNEDSVERSNLAELAAALHASIIFAGYPGNWSWDQDGMYAAMDLAADLLAGSALSTVKAVFRMKSTEPGGFQSGSVLRGTLGIESDVCPMGCAELPLQFAVDIP